MTFRFYYYTGYELIAIWPGDFSNAFSALEHDPLYGYKYFKIYLN